MKAKPILLSLVMISAMSFPILTGYSQGVTAQANKSETNVAPKEQHAEEIRALKAEAERVITEFNSTAEDVKYNAIINNKNLNSEVKNTIIELEIRVLHLEDKLDNMKYQSSETWSKFRSEMIADIQTIKKGIKNLSSNIG